MRGWARGIVFLVFVGVSGAVLVRHSGSWLVRDEPRSSDVVLVLAGDVNDRRYGRGLDLLRAGYGKRMLVDASEDETFYGRSPADLAREFIPASAGLDSARVEVCPIQGDSTVLETRFAGRCLQRLGAQTVLLVTSDFHTRRALAIFKKELPQYSWTSAAAFDQSRYGVRWWKNREWSKTYLTEYEKLAWWTFVERWRRLAVAGH